MLTWLVPHLTLIAGVLASVVVLAVMLRQRRSPSSSMAWLLAIVLMPYIGIPLYLMLGGRKLRRLAEAKPDLRLPAADPAGFDTPGLDRLLRGYGLPGAASGNRMTLCRDGEDVFAQLLALIDGARTRLHIATYILAGDAVGRIVIDRLARRAAAGVEVRLLLDGFGSLWLRRSRLLPLVRAGGRVATFMPMIHMPFSGRGNLRNHRKLVIVDDRVVLAGGTNIALDYIGPVPAPGRWRDLSFVLEGPAVRHYGDVFRSDWAFAAGENLAPPAAGPEPAGTGLIQVVPSGPDVPDDPLFAAILTACFAARTRLWIVTPYFIPDPTLAEALSIAAHRGVDVRVVVPARSNHRVADLARGGYLRGLQAAGARVLRFGPGMIHAKVMVMDEDVAMVGSANFDARSLFLNFEIASFAYGAAEVRAVADWIAGLFDATEAGVPAVGALRDLGEAVVRLVAPLL